ncbi:MAG TPA: C40 family peptidase [Ktedonobacterales bacterium]|nr:C40 family peptidase [Ktedonobacterales bacterium]
MTYTPSTPTSPAFLLSSPRASAEDAPLAVAVAVADVRSEPNDGSELVTQALLGVAAQHVAEVNGWVRVHLPDYEGWMRSQDLAQPAEAADKVAVVTALQTPIFLDAAGENLYDTAYVTTALPVLESTSTSGCVCVALPGSACGWIDATSVAIHAATQPFPRGTVEDVLALARQMLGVPYLWGGATPRATDCSGLVQICWRHAGITLRRDANQQYESITNVVARGELRAGDLAFFARDGRIVHVGLMLDGKRILHADGTTRHQVTINGLTPESEDYRPRLDALYAGARRPLP